MTPREFFPRMPDEVFDIWLAPLIESKGWPFRSIDDDLQASDWRYVLGIDCTLKQWCMSEWKLIKINLSEAKFTAGNICMIKAIVRNAAFDHPTETENIENTKERFRACVAFFNEHGNIPKPIITHYINGGFNLMDGNHRMAAIAHVGAPSNISIPAWIAEFNET